MLLKILQVTFTSWGTIMMKIVELLATLPSLFRRFVAWHFYTIIISLYEIQLALTLRLGVNTLLGGNKPFLGVFTLA